MSSSLSVIDAPGPPSGLDSLPLSLAGLSLTRSGSPPVSSGSASSESSEIASIPSLSGASSVSNQSANASSVDGLLHAADVPAGKAFRGANSAHAALLTAMDSRAMQGASSMHTMVLGRARPSASAANARTAGQNGDTNQLAALSLQPKLLKQINSHHTKEELLVYIASCYTLLDDINLVTCIYRLARMFSNVKNLAARMVWSSELLEDPTFFKLIGTLKSHMLQAQAQLVHNGSVQGFDARCVCNLVWAVVKLEIPMEAGDVGYDLIQAVSPLVLFFLQSSSSQGLANLLWAYSKMPVPLVHVIMLIIQEMSTRLEASQSEFDAQALSNSIWALAHVRGRVPDLDERVGGPGMSVRFMLGIASCTLGMLRGLHSSAAGAASTAAPACMADAERQFSCQALVNICWSFATMLGDDCHRIPAIFDVFVCVRTEALLRLRATATALQLNQPWVHRLQGGFNEQALSNLVYAFDKAHLLDADLLSLVYCVASYRLDRRGNSGQLAFKPQELCTLLRAAQVGAGSAAQPWSFLEKLQKLVTNNPRLVSAWTAAECAELERGFALLGIYRLTLLVQQQQQAAAAAAAMQYLPFSGAGLGSGLGGFGAGLGGAGTGLGALQSANLGAWGGYGGFGGPFQLPQELGGVTGLGSGVGVGI